MIQARCLHYLREGISPQIAGLMVLRVAMFIRHDELRLAAKLRSSIMALLKGVTASSGLLPFSDPSPNRLSRDRIEAVASRLKEELLARGAIPIELHGDCGRLSHFERASSIGKSTGHWCVSVPGRNATDIVPVQDGSGILRIDGHLYTTDFDDAIAGQSLTRKRCICSPIGRQEEHAVAHHIAWVPDVESSIGDFGRIYRQLLAATNASADKLRRSSIREELLLALLELERLIVPETADEHIAVRHALDDWQFDLGTPFPTGLARA